MARKIIFSIFAILCSTLFLIPSSSVSAIEGVASLRQRNNSGGLPSSNYSTTSCGDNSNGWRSDYWQIVNSSSHIKCIHTRYPSGKSVTVKSGDYISAIIMIRYYYASAPILTPRYFNNGNRIIQFNLLSSTTQSEYVTSYYEVLMGSESSWTGDIAIPLTIDAESYPTDVQVQSWSTWYPADYTANLDSIKSTISSSNQSIVNAINNMASSSSSASKEQLEATKELNQTIKDQQQKEEDAINQGQDDAQTGADSSQSDVNSSTSSLFEILGQFVGSITSAKATNCEIDFNVGFWNSGKVNLCTGGSKVQTITAIIGTVMLLGLVISLCWSAISEMLRLFGSFQK